MLQKKRYFTICKISWVMENKTDFYIIFFSVSFYCTYYIIAYYMLYVHHSSLVARCSVNTCFVCIHNSKNNHLNLKYKHSKWQWTETLSTLKRIEVVFWTCTFISKYDYCSNMKKKSIFEQNQIVKYDWYRKKLRHMCCLLSDLHLSE